MSRKIGGSCEKCRTDLECSSCNPISRVSVFFMALILGFYGGIYLQSELGYEKQEVAALGCGAYDRNTGKFYEIEQPKKTKETKP